MARRRSKKRTHANPASSQNGTHVSATRTGSGRNPKTMVIRIGAGQVGSSVSQLAADIRKAMEPDTASRLKERRANRLRDYVTMCGPLGVTHLLLFSRSESGNVNLRIACAPRGPTLHFRVEKYSLTKDIQRAQRHPKSPGGKEYIQSPLLVMNNFNLSTDANDKVPKHLESLATTVIQSLFPPINPQATPLTSVRRTLLLNREQSSADADKFVLNFRHYAITTKATGISKPLKRLNAAQKLVHSKRKVSSGLPNLGKLQDIADYMVGGEDGQGYVTDGGTSGSEAETDAEVDVLETTARRINSKPGRDLSSGPDEERSASVSEMDSHVERRAVKLLELGPRMKLRLIKVEEGLCQGQVMWHEHVHKSQDEINELQDKWDKLKRERDARKKEQEENVRRKRELTAKKSAGKQGKADVLDGGGGGTDGNGGSSDATDSYDVGQHVDEVMDDDDDSDEWEDDGY